MKKKIIVCGHYGSGKTEFSLNLAVRLAKINDNVALIDLDIANVYFRSRELREILKENGISIYGNAFNHDITAEIPALSADIRKPLEDKECYAVLDLGGNESGAKILNQFTKYFDNNNYELFCVINANRPETGSMEGALIHIKAIEKVTGLSVTGLVNNTHMLKYTSAADVIKGIHLCKALSKELKVPVVFNCFPKNVIAIDEFKHSFFEDDIENFPMDIFMRPQWMDL